MSEFKVGDPVSVAGAPGEWTITEITEITVDDCHTVRQRMPGLLGDFRFMYGLFASQLTLLPTPTPEPPVGKVVRWKNGGLIFEHTEQGWWRASDGARYSWDRVSRYDFEVLESERVTVEKILTALDADWRPDARSQTWRIGWNSARAVVAQIGEQG